MRKLLKRPHGTPSSPLHSIRRILSCQSAFSPDDQWEVYEFMAELRGIGYGRGSLYAQLFSIHVELDELPCDREDDALADICYPIGGALKIMGGPEQIIGTVDQSRVLQNHRDQVTMYLVV